MIPCRTPKSPLSGPGYFGRVGTPRYHSSARLCLLFLAAIALPAPFSAAARSPQATEIPSYPERPTPSQSAVPGSPSTRRPAPELPKTEQYTLSQDRYEKAVAYSRQEYILYLVSYLLGVVVLLLILRLGIAARLRDFAETVSGNRWLQGLVFVPLLIGILDLCDLPVHLYGHSLSLRYEQSVQGWGSWFWDWSKGELLSVSFAVVLVLIVFAVMRWSPRRWWFYSWLATLPILLFVLFVSPWFVDPLFNTFHPLDGRYPALTAEMEKVVRRTGLDIPPDRMFLMDASKKTNNLNAYVTGFGASKRVVVWDTTVQKLTTGETLFIFGHEAGHYVLNHVRNGFLFFAAMLLVAFYLGYRGLHWALGRWDQDWKIYGSEDWASLAVLLLLLQVIVFFSLPIANGFSRAQEHAADVYGLEVIHGIVPNAAEIAAHAFQVLGEVGLADPNPPPIITFWLYSHPPLAERLVFAHSYDPWSKGQPPKYVKGQQP
jgi:Zn-dependent protease with chaperone function